MVMRYIMRKIETDEFCCNTSSEMVHYSGPNISKAEAGGSRC